MQTGQVVIIHQSLIIQQGLKNILLARNIVICDIMYSIPEYAIISSWKDSLLLVDTLYADGLKMYSRSLAKNGNIIMVIETEILTKPVSKFEDVLNIYESADTILQKINKYISRVSYNKSNNKLSMREIEILTLVAKGFSNKIIAGQLFLSIHTVITHRKNITSKLGIKSISGLTLYAALNNMVDAHS